jgi:hypothetical protein
VVVVAFIRLVAAVQTLEDLLVTVEKEAEDFFKEVLEEDLYVTQYPVGLEVEVGLTGMVEEQEEEEGTLGVLVGTTTITPLGVVEDRLTVEQTKVILVAITTKDMDMLL